MSMLDYISINIPGGLIESAFISTKKLCNIDVDIVSLTSQKKKNIIEIKERERVKLKELSKLIILIKYFILKLANCKF